LSLRPKFPSLGGVVRSTGVVGGFMSKENFAFNPGKAGGKMRSYAEVFLEVDKGGSKLTV